MAIKQWPQDKVEQIMHHLQFLSDRATGKVPTGAHFIRSFVTQHPQYQKDSKLTDQMNFDLLKMMSTLNDKDSEGRRGLLGEYAWAACQVANVDQFWWSYYFTLTTKRQTQPHSKKKKRTVRNKQSFKLYWRDPNLILLRSRIATESWLPSHLVK